MSVFRASFALRAPICRNAVSRSMGATRSFQSCRALAVGKESALHEEGRSEEVAKKRDEHVQSQKEGKNKWTEDLASDSESAVKADRGDNKDAQKDIDSLQKETAKAAEQNKEGKMKKAP